jgi:hypothetical protein
MYCRIVYYVQVQCIGHLRTTSTSTATLLRQHYNGHVNRLSGQKLDFLPCNSPCSCTTVHVLGVVLLPYKSYCSSTVVSTPSTTS